MDIIISIHFIRTFAFIPQKLRSRESKSDRAYFIATIFSDVSNFYYPFQRQCGNNAIDGKPFYYIAN